MTIPLSALVFRLPPSVSNAAIVFGDAAVGAIRERDLRRIVADIFGRAGVSAEILAGVGALTPRLRLALRAKDAIDLPPRELLGYYGLDPEREKQFDAATTALVISLDAAPEFPSTASWVVILAAALAARAVGTTPPRLVFDPGAGRFLSAEAIAAPLKSMSKASVVDHIVVLASSDELGYRLSTQGLSKFGLPELAMAEVTDRDAAVWLVNAAAQALAESTAAKGIADGRLGISRTQSVERAHAARAYMLDAPSEAAEVAVVLRACDDPPGSIELEPPPGTSREAWMSESRRVLGFVDERAGDEAQEQVKRSGLRPGEEISAARELFQNDSAATVFVNRRFEADGFAEYIWLRVRDWRDGRVRGVVAGVPRFTREVRQGDLLEIEEGQIAEWVIDRPDGVPPTVLSPQSIGAVNG